MSYQIGVLNSFKLNSSSLRIGQKINNREKKLTILVAKKYVKNIWNSPKLSLNWGKLPLKQGSFSLKINLEESNPEKCTVTLKKFLNKIS